MRHKLIHNSILLKSRVRKAECEIRFILSHTWYVKRNSIVIVNNSYNLSFLQKPLFLSPLNSIRAETLNQCLMHLYFRPESFKITLIDSISFSKALICCLGLLFEYFFLHKNDLRLFSESLIHVSEGSVTTHCDNNTEQQ